MLSNINAAGERAALRNEAMELSRKVYSGKELLEMEIEEVPKLWEPALVRVGISVLGGSSDCGKSTLSQQLAYNICKGSDKMFGGKLNAPRKSALIVATEDDVESVASKLTKQLRQEEDKSFMENLTIMFDSESVLKEVREALDKKPCDLVVIDTWSDTVKGNFNDIGNVRPNLHEWRKVAIDYQCHVILLHHTVKYSEKAVPDKNRLNGSQAIEAKVRCYMELRPVANPNQRALTVLKCNNMSAAAKAQSWILDFDENTLCFSYSGKKVDKQQLVSGSTGRYDSLKEEAMHLRQSGLSFDKVRQELRQKYGEVNTPGLTWLKENC